MMTMTMMIMLEMMTMMASPHSIIDPVSQSGRLHKANLVMYSLTCELTSSQEAIP